MTAALMTAVNESAHRTGSTMSAPTMPEGTSQTQHDQCTTDAPTGQTPRAKLVPKTNPGRVADHIREAYRIVDGLWRSSQRAGGDYAWLDLNGIRLCVRAEGGQPALVLWRGPANLRKWRGVYEASWGLAFTAAHYERESAAPIVTGDDDTPQATWGDLTTEAQALLVLLSGNSGWQPVRGAAESDLRALDRRLLIFWRREKRDARITSSGLDLIAANVIAEVLS